MEVGSASVSAIVIVIMQSRSLAMPDLLPPRTLHDSAHLSQAWRLLGTEVDVLTPGLLCQKEQHARPARVVLRKSYPDSSGLVIVGVIIIAPDSIGFMTYKYHVGEGG